MADKVESDDRVPVLIALGEISDRNPDPEAAFDSLGLMMEALKAAERDAGTPILDRLDWLGVEDQISFPDPALHETLAERLPALPPIRVKTFEASGDGPIQLIADAANLIGEGRIRLGAAVGAEALRTAAKRAQAAAAAGNPPPPSAIAASAAAGATPMARKHKLFTPTDVYPLYENATRAAWGQTLAEGQAESATIWSNSSKVAAANPSAWLRTPVEPAAIAEPTADNRLISFPYTKLMVANASVNQGCAVIIASLSMARELGVPEERIVYVGASAAAHEPDDFLMRDSFARATSLETTLTTALDRNGLGKEDLAHVELYSCFPVVPKMARRVLGWPAEKPTTVYGGLTFGGGPIGNCMMHAVARMIVNLRGTDGHGLIVANGGYATHSHSIVLTRRPVPAGTFPLDYDVQAEAEAKREPVPALLDDYEGEGVIETYSIPFDRHGKAARATIVARNPAGERFLATVPAEDEAAIAFLTSGAAEPVGTAGRATRDASGGVRWTM